MRVAAVNTREDRAIVSRQFQVHSDPDYCTMHLINEGVTVTGNNVTIEFAVVGPAEGVTCQLDNQPQFSCEQHHSLLYHLFNVSLCVCVCVCVCVRACVTDVRSSSSRSSGHLEGPGPLIPIQQVQHPLSVSGEENEYHYTQRKQSVG